MMPNKVRVFTLGYQQGTGGEESEDMTPNKVRVFTLGYQQGTGSDEKSTSMSPPRWERRHTGVAIVGA
jgi:hypothetical protein